MMVMSDASNRCKMPESLKYKAVLIVVFVITCISEATYGSNAGNL
jgi:hypothetical protein